MENHFRRLSGLIFWACFLIAVAKLCAVIWVPTVVVHLQQLRDDVLALGIMLLLYERIGRR